MRDPLARQIVRDALRLRERDRLWIHTWKHTQDLAEEIAQEALTRGATPLISLSTDALFRHALKKAPQEAVVTPPDHWSGGVAKATALVLLEGPQDPSILKTAEKGKAMSLIGHQASVLGAAYAHGVRALLVHTTAITPKAAQVYGVNHAKWRKAVEQCMAANQAEILSLARRIEKLLRRHSTIHISSREGTDLRLRIRSSKLIIDDGVIDQEDIRRKSFIAHLPGGTITVAVDESSAEGSVIFDLPRAFLGDVVNDLRLDFKKGHITGVRALRGESTFTGALEAASGDKDRLSSLTFGINPNAQALLGMPTDALVQGTVTLGIGDNTFIGGRARSTFSYQHTLSSAIVGVGPTAIITEGKLSI